MTPAPLRVDAAVIPIRAPSADLYAAASYTMSLALAAFLEHDFARSEWLTEEAREMRREGDGALLAELAMSVRMTGGAGR